MSGKGKVTFWPSGRSISVRAGTTLLDAARRAGVPVRTRCGGKAACFMCKVNVREGSRVAPAKDNERRKLAGMEEHTRLSCQAIVLGDANVDVPDDPLRSAVLKQLARQDEEDKLW